MARAEGRSRLQRAVALALALPGALAAAAAAPPDALAVEMRTLALVPAYGSGDEATLRRVDAMLYSELSRRRYSVFVADHAGPLVRDLGCPRLTPACAAKLGQRLGADEVVVALLSPDRFRGFLALHLWRFDGRRAATLSETEGAFVPIGHKLERAVAFFVGRLMVASGPLRVETSLEAPPIGPLPREPGAERPPPPAAPPAPPEVAARPPDAGGPLADLSREEGAPRHRAAARPRIRALTWAALGAGGAALLAGAVLGVATLRAESRLDRLAADLPDPATLHPLYIEDLEEAARLNRRGPAFAGAATAGFVIGGAALAVAGALLYLDLRRGREAKAAVTLAPAVAPGYAGVAISY